VVVGADEGDTEERLVMSWVQLKIDTEELWLLVMSLVVFVVVYVEPSKTACRCDGLNRGDDTKSSCELSKRDAQRISG
jgi:hypothetical protein